MRYLNSPQQEVYIVVSTSVMPQSCGETVGEYIFWRLSDGMRHQLIMRWGISGFSSTAGVHPDMNTYPSVPCSNLYMKSRG